MRQWLAGPMPANVADALARLRQTPDVARIAVMPDVHLAGPVCIGTVVATNHLLFPDAVGGDIGCGMAAIGFNVSAQRLGDPRTAERLFEDLGRTVPVLRHEGSSVGDLPDVLRSRPLIDPTLQKEAMRDGRWFDPRRARSLRDEAPSAYKDIQQVLRAQKDLTRIVRRLQPVLCYKGT